MNKCIKYYFKLLMILFIPFLLFSETLLLQESFEGTNNYEANEFTAYDPDDEFSWHTYFLPYTATYYYEDDAQRITWSNFDESHLFMGEETDGGTPSECVNPLGNDEWGYVVLTPVDFSDYDSVRIKILFGACDDESHLNHHIMELQYAFDDDIASSGAANVNTGTYTRITSFAGSDAIYSRNAQEDTDNNGFGDGTTLSQSLQEFTYIIPVAGEKVSIRVTIKTKSSSSEYAFDDIRIYGIGSPKMEVRAHGYLIPNKNNYPESIPDTINYTDFGSVDLGSGKARNMRIWNLGNELLDILSTPPIIISGENADDFEIISISKSGSTVDTSGRKVVRFQFTPSGVGLRTATFTIKSNDTKHNNDIYFFDVQGTGVGRPEMEVKGNDIVIQNKNNYPTSEPSEDNFTDFGSVDVNSSIAHSVKIFNNGNDDLNFLSTPHVVISGEHASDFAITTQPTDPLTAGGWQETVITFTPTASGLRTATVTIETNDYDNSNDEFVFDIQGTGVDDTSLPIELESFSARCLNHSVILEWITESEFNNLGYIVERSNDGNSWITISSYINNSELEGQGNSSIQTNYSYLDKEVDPGMTYHYRISDVSTSNEITIHPSLSITLEALPERTKMDAAYPNPFNPTTLINYQLAKDSRIKIDVYNLLGRNVKTLYSGYQSAGSYNVYWNGRDNHGNNAALGTYLIRLQTEESAQVQKVLLMK